MPLTGILAGLAAGALWGLVFVVPQLAPGFSDADLTAGRFGVYGLIGLVALLVRGPRLALTMLLSRHAAMACLLSFLGFGAYSLCLLEAIRQGGSEVSAMVVGTLPVWMMLLGRPKGLGWSHLWPGALLTCAGLMLMTWSRLAGTDTLTESVSAAWMLACLATFCWLAYALLNSHWLRRYPQIDNRQWADLVGVATGVQALALWLGWGTPTALLMAHPGWERFVVVSLFTGLGCAWLATVLWNEASRRLPASLAGQLIVSETLFALLYAAALQGQWPSVTALAACGLFLAGILATLGAHP